MRFLGKFFRHKTAVFCSFCLGLLLLCAIFAPYLAPYDPYEADYEALSALPSLTHLMGTDDLGRDVLSRIIYGSRISLLIAFSSVFLGGLLGVSLGLASGYFAGLMDALLMRFCDVLFAFPGILLAIAVVAILGPGLSSVIIAVATFSVPAFARLVRAEVLSLKTKAYVEAAQSMGASDLRVILLHILPGVLPVTTVLFTMRLGLGILTAASLSFLGLGPEPDVPEWGNILGTSRNLMMAGAWHASVFPGLAIFFAVLSFNLLGDALKDLLDPKAS